MLRDGYTWKRYRYREMLQFGRIIDYPGQSYLGSSIVPDLLRAIQRKVEKLTGESYDQLTCNHYRPGDSITYHVDDPVVFGRTIVSLSCSDSFIYFRIRDSLFCLQTLNNLLIPVCVCQTTFQKRTQNKCKNSKMAETEKITKMLHSGFASKIFIYYVE